MTELDGIEYEVKTPEENRDDLVTYINNYCAQNDIRNSKGELIYIDPNMGNPLYIFAQGVSYLTSVLQKLIYSAGCNVSIAASSPRQLLELCDLAGIHRRPASTTVIPCLIYADVGPCEITQSLSVTLTIDNNNVVFHPALDITVPANGVVNVPLITEEYGSYNIVANSITEFDTQVPNLLKMVTSDSIPGQDEETIASLRERLQQRGVSGTRIDRAAAAIRDLPGINNCSIFFNYSPTTAEVIGSLTVPPRTALLLVQGFNTEITKTFYSYLICPTAAGPAERTIEQPYVTHANQQIPCHIITPLSTPVSINVYVKGQISDLTKKQVKEAVCSLASSIGISQGADSAQVIQVLNSLVPAVTVQGVSLSLDGGSTWDYKVVPAVDELISFNTNDVTIWEDY